MYEIRFEATDDADWAEAIELIDNETSLALEGAADAVFEIQVTDCGTAVLSATTEDDTITKPEDNIISWRFTKAQMGSLCTGKTYAVGCTMTTDDGTEQLFIGSLAVIDGYVS